MGREPAESVRDALWRVGGELRGDGRGWVLLFVAGGWFFVLGTRFVFPALLPEIKTAFALSNTTAGAAITAIWIAYAAVQFPAGALSDRLGERLVPVASVLIATVAVAVVALTPTFALFLLGAVLFGLGTGLYGPPRVIVLSNTFAERNRDSTAIALTFAAGSLGSAALPFVGGRLASALDWRAGFAAVLVPILLVSVGLWRFLPEYASTAEKAAGRSARHVAGRLASTVTDRSVLLAWAGMSLSLFVFQGVTSFLPTYLVSVKGLPTGTAATVFGAFFVVGAVAQPVSGALGDRFGRRRVLVALAGVGAVPLALLPFGYGLPVLAALAVFLGVRLGLGPLNNAYIADAFPSDVQGAGYGFVRTFHMAIGSTGAVAIGYLADASLFDEAFLLLAGLSLVSMLLYAGLPATDDRERDGSEG
jgi:MFS family permease